MSTADARIVVNIPGYATKGSVVVLAPGVVRNDNPRTKTWSHAAGWLALAEMKQHGHVGVPTGAIALTVNFYMRNTRKADIDKLLRALLDALEGVCYWNDRQVDHVTAFKSPAEEPHTLVVISFDATTLSVEQPTAGHPKKPTRRQSQRTATSATRGHQ